MKCQNPLGYRAYAPTIPWPRTVRLMAGDALFSLDVAEGYPESCCIYPFMAGEGYSKELASGTQFVSVLMRECAEESEMSWIHLQVTFE